MTGQARLSPVPFPSGSPQLLGVLLALLSAAGFASLGIWGKLAAQLGLSSATLLSWRFALAALVLFALGFGRERVPWRARLLMLGAGLVYSVATTFYFAALGRISAGTTSLLLYLAPAFVVLFALMLGRRPGRVQLAALACTLLGLGVVVGFPGGADRDALGLGMAATAGALYGAYLLGSERLLGGLRPFTVTAHVTLAAGLYFTLWGALNGTLGVPLGVAQWGLVAGITVCSTLLAVPALFAAVYRLGAERASVLATTEPLWTVLLAAVVLGEALRGGQLAGGLLILLGGAAAQLAPALDRKRRPATVGPAGGPERYSN